MVRALETEIPLATVAALLTALEYVLSILSALSARAAVHGVWLYGLHRGGEAPISGGVRERRAYRKEALATVLGVWLVIGVGLIESNLRVGTRLINSPVQSDLCVSVYGRYHPERIAMHRPTYRPEIEAWVLDSAKKIKCERNGVATIGVGAKGESYGRKKNMFAPVCANRTVDVARTELVVKVSDLLLTKHCFVFRPEKGSPFLILPHDGSNLGKDINRNAPENEGSGPCGEKGISLYMTKVSESFETATVRSENVSLAVHEAICSAHDKTRNIEAVPDAIATSCFPKSPGMMLDAGCLRENGGEKLVGHAILKGLSVLFFGEKTGSPSYVCTSARLKVEYMFVNPKVITQRIRGALPQLPVLIPMRLKALDGRCERTIAPLGQAALLYAADAEWANDELSKLSRITRLHAYLMMASESQFPLNKVKSPESAKAPDGSCMVRPVHEVTEIPMDWRFAIFALGVCFTAVVGMVSIMFRFRYKGEAWKVGSAQWSLERLLGGSEASKKAALVEIVPIDGDGPESMGSATSSTFAAGESQLEYRVRTFSVRNSGAIDASRGIAKDAGM